MEVNQMVTLHKDDLKLLLIKHFSNDESYSTSEYMDIIGYLTTALRKDFDLNQVKFIEKYQHINKNLDHE